MIRADRVVLLTSDRDYLIPSLVVACQLSRQRRSAEDYDILILLLGFSPAERAAIAAKFEPQGLLFEHLEQDLFSQNTGLHFEKSHVPMSAMARLSSAPYLSPRHKHVIYLDGDVQIRGDIASLLHYTVKGGHILAATDRYIISQSSTGYSGRLWRSARSYLDCLDIKDPASYFNSGVLAASKEAWSEICTDALDFYKANSSLCLFHDQSALNAVCKNRHETMSPVYNYTTPFALAAGVAVYEPAIVHFTGSDKPWLFSRRPPWRGYGQPYRDILQDHPTLAPYASDWPAKQAALGADVSVPISAIGALSNTLRTGLSRSRLNRYMRRGRFPF